MITKITKDTIIQKCNTCGELNEINLDSLKIVQGKAIPLPKCSHCKKSIETLLMGDGTDINSMLASKVFVLLALKTDKE